MTRELSLQRSRAEETQRSNEALKQQMQNVTDRLRNFEHSHEANLSSISRKDRKIEDLKAEVLGEKKRRVKAEEDARRTDQLAAQERDEHHKGLAAAQEMAHHAKSQYDTVVSTRSKEKSEYQSRFSSFRKELDELFAREEERQNQLKRFDVIIEQKNREIDTGRERMDRCEMLSREYKEQSDRTLRELVENGQKKDADIDKALAAAKETTDKMKWVLNVKKQVEDAS